MSLEPMNITLDPNPVLRNEAASEEDHGQVNRQQGKEIKALHWKGSALPPMKSLLTEGLCVTVTGHLLHF